MRGIYDNLKEHELEKFLDDAKHCMEEMFISGKPLYPVERTLLTTCTLSMLFESRAWKKRIETDQLRISYRALPDTYFQRA